LIRSADSQGREQEDAGATTHRALVKHVRGRVRGGLRGDRLGAEYRTQVRRAFARLERGLGDYDVKP